MNINWATITKIMNGQLEGKPLTPCTGITIDSRKIEKDQLYFALTGDRFDGHDFAGDALTKGASAVVTKAGHCEKLSPRIVVADPLRAMQLLGGYVRSLVDIPVVAITGSHGKTRTKDILASIVKQHHPGSLSTFQNLNGLIGVPLTLLQLERSTPSLVIEVGISMPGEMNILAPLVKPTIAIFTCVAPAHSEFLPTLDEIAIEKSYLMDNVLPEGKILLNADDPLIMKHYRWSNAITFGLDSGDYRGKITAKLSSSTEISITGPDNEYFSINLPMIGVHNATNAIAACVAARLMEIPITTIQDGLKKIDMSPHRSRIINHHGIIIIDDTYNAAPKSMLMALKMLQEYPTLKRRIAVLGDMLELGESSTEAHKQLGKNLVKTRPDAFFAFGPQMISAIKIVSDSNIPCQHFMDNNQIGMELAKFLNPGDVILIKASRTMCGEKIISDLLASY
ncbi:UDP-N-acetylmuramoyl-tripeptide--D-alanyl-D-alanine ligase [bacterium]|nr:UDP-N-acetylmuramoyl-tripeptide--D-alanyl-D-alanine ligase [bacterium]